MSIPSKITNAKINRISETDTGAHDWYRFVLSFPPHLVRSYIDRFGLTVNDCILDPFCGTGTTIVECKKIGIPSIGVEAHPMSAFASRVKTDWNVDPLGLKAHSEQIAEEARERLREEGVPDEDLLLITPTNESSDIFPKALRTLPEDSFKLLLTNSVSPIPLHKTIILLDAINRRHDERFYDHQMLALAKALVSSISNLHFGPEVGIGKIKQDARVTGSWLDCIKSMSNDLLYLRSKNETPAKVYNKDSRVLSDTIFNGTVSAVITSPPYPNEKDYTRTTRLESVILGFIKNKAELKQLKQHLLRSNTRNVYKADNDDHWVTHCSEVEHVAQMIERRRIELGKTSGFERLYHRVTRLYFGGMARHFSDLTKVLKPGAQLAYVVGDQASYLRVMIRTGQLLAEIAESHGYEVVGIDLFRTRLATATRDQLREEVVLLRWNGTARNVSENRAGYSVTKSSRPSEIKMKSDRQNRYSQIIEKIFISHYKKGKAELFFGRDEIEKVAAKLGIKLPKNLGDVIYSFRYRAELPKTILKKATSGKQWIIRPAGRSKYCFALVSEQNIAPNEMLTGTKIPDATPGIISLYALSDEQALLARLRYNRLIDIFTSITCYSLQSHLRSSVPNMGQVETDELYIGVDKKGVHYVFPVQAKGGRDKINVVQIEQDFALCAAKFPLLICRAIGAQFLKDNLIALFEFENTPEGVRVAAERHYQLVSPDEVTPALLSSYRERLPEG